MAISSREKRLELRFLVLNFCFPLQINRGSVKVVLQVGVISDGPALPLFSVCDYVIVAGAEKGFPSTNSKRKKALQFVMLPFMCYVHESAQHGKAARVVGGSAQPALHKWPRDWIHFTKARICQTFLRGERIGGEGSSKGGESKRIAGIKEFMNSGRRLQDDKRCRW